MVKRVFIAVVFLVIMISSAGAADLPWKISTPAQEMLKDYIETVNRYLESRGETPVNSLFEMFPAIAVFGITGEPNAETPEDVEITVTLMNDRISQLQLRVCSTDRFPAIAACLIQALYGENISAEEAISAPADRAQRAAANPRNSFAETIDAMNGSVPRFYYAYYPDQYHDGKNWLQMTIIFPRETVWSGKEMIVGTTDEKGVDPNSGVSEDYEGYYSDDDYDHFELFVTPTPEPDSAAAEYDFR